MSHMLVAQKMERDGGIRGGLPPSVRIGREGAVSGISFPQATGVVCGGARVDEHRCRGNQTAVIGCLVFKFLCLYKVDTARDCPAIF